MASKLVRRRDDGPELSGEPVTEVIMCGYLVLWKYRQIGPSYSSGLSCLVNANMSATNLVFYVRLFYNRMGLSRLLTKTNFVNSQSLY